MCREIQKYRQVIATLPVTSSTCWMMVSRRAAPLDNSRSVTWLSSSTDLGGPSVRDHRQFQNWSGARDLNPGPHGPESHDLPSSREDFVLFQFEIAAPRDAGRPDLRHSSARLLHELLHERSAHHPAILGVVAA